MKQSGVVVRRARVEDVEPIVRLIAAFADEALMLRRTPEMVELAIDDYVVGVDPWGRVIACGALKEYSASVAEVAAIAVSRDVHGQGVGRAIVAAVEALAIKRGTFDVFALTLQPAFFSAIGYQRVDRARYPEKIRRDCLACARRFACDEFCFAKNLQVDAPMAAHGRSLGDGFGPAGSGVVIAPRHDGRRQVA
ncbi:MAG TPA: GNAT family N-acetyltransferase [Gemmatimonadaceae bacterium]|nr:GNAT family N-acetyltransferase [Gemmatimonadaceae bacterium]